jgi:hypothetical protein
LAAGNGHAANINIALENQIEIRVRHRILARQRNFASMLKSPPSTHINYMNSLCKKKLYTVAVACDSAGKQTDFVPAGG